MRGGVTTDAQVDTTPLARVTGAGGGAVRQRGDGA